MLVAGRHARLELAVNFELELQVGRVDGASAGGQRQPGIVDPGVGAECVAEPEDGATAAELAENPVEADAAASAASGAVVRRLAATA